MAHSTALRTDHYELTMLEAALRSGVASRRSVFEVFCRRLPPGRRYGVVAGTGRLLEELADFRFGDAELGWLADQGVVGDDTLAFLADYRFSGAIRGYREGELFVAYSPVLTIESSFAEAVILETLVLSVLNHDSAVASAASRMVEAADGRPLLEAGSRRTHDGAAPAAARSAYIAGFAGSSNLEAGYRWGVPTGGTAGHALTLAHDSERAAFEAQIDCAGPATTFLVDTFDVERAVNLAIDLTEGRLAAVRIDSGDLGEMAASTRALLDRRGATQAEIVVSGDLDEHRISALAPAPVDRFLVGTEVVTGAGAATAGLVYKLVAIADGRSGQQGLRPVGKRSPGKAYPTGSKDAYRITAQRSVTHELVGDRGLAPPPNARPLQIDFVGGSAEATPDLAASREHHRWALAELDPELRRPEPGPPAFEVMNPPN